MHGPKSIDHVILEELTWQWGINQVYKGREIGERECGGDSNRISFLIYSSAHSSETKHWHLMDMVNKWEREGDEEREALVYFLAQWTFSSMLVCVWGDFPQVSETPSVFERSYSTEWTKHWQETFQKVRSLYLCLSASASQSLVILRTIRSI